MFDMLVNKWKVMAVAGAFLAATAAAPILSAAPRHGGSQGGGHQIRHVLLISVDGLHAVDFLNCSKGISGINGGAPYCPNLAALAVTGINYLNTSTSKPSDSFPGLMALMTGGSPRSFGAFYDVAYDRSLNGPVIDTGNGNPGTGAAGCPSTPTGYSTEYDEGIDLKQAQLNGGAPTGVDGGEQSIDPMKLDRDPANGCAPVYPWDFIRTNTIFGVLHNAGLYTAWTDKHPSYSSVSGHGTGGKAVDDYYSPEINSIPVALPNVTVPAFGGNSSFNCFPALPDTTAVASSNAWTDSFANIQCYDRLKVNSILNEINGKNHAGAGKAPRPALLGMNFQVVSVGQKLIEPSVGMTGGYADAIGTPTAPLLDEIEYADEAIGEFVQALKANGIYDETLIVITAKHGQSPVDSSHYQGISTFTGDPITTSPVTILDSMFGCIPVPEDEGPGPTEDDVSLIWLNSSCTTAQAITDLEKTSPTSDNIAGIGEIFAGPNLQTYFNAPGLPPLDPRTPDIIVTPNIGVTYSGSGKKLAEHGGFSRDDTNVIMLVSNPSFEPQTVDSPVETEQVAPTILQALGFDPNQLDAVREEGTQVLPAVQFGGDEH